MAAITFYGDSAGPFNIDLQGSGLGFYGSGGFGASVAVAAWQDNTYITDGNGAIQGPQSNNVKWTHANSGEVSGSTNLGLQYIPNAQATLNIRFTHGSAVQVQNAELRIYDRVTITVGATGVTTRVAEIIHTSPSQVVVGSGDSAWITPEGSGTTVPLVQSPGISGIAGHGSSTTPAAQHDWYVAISARPDSIGSKTQYGMYVALEYL
jgi:hypothetical protein